MFKIVRMGETERMHEKVKKISMFEQSEKEAQKMKTRDKEKKRKDIKRVLYYLQSNPACF